MKIQYYAGLIISYIHVFCTPQTSIALVYSESIEKLKGVLQAMQNASQKREKLEKQLREQLQSEISRLKESTAAGADSTAGGGAGRTNSKQEKSELQQQILLLETEVAKVCTDSLHISNSIFTSSC